MLEGTKYAINELKRVEHLVYVSLKYTRTVDVLMNVVGRMIEVYKYGVEGLTRQLVEEEKIEEMPTTPLEQANLVLNNYDNEIIQENIKLYLLLRKISKEPNPMKEQEYRRHVCATFIINQKEVKINIDAVTEYYHMQTEFLELLKSMLE